MRYFPFSILVYTSQPHLSLIYDLGMYINISYLHYMQTYKCIYFYLFLYFKNLEMYWVTQCLVPIHVKFCKKWYFKTCIPSFGVFAKKKPEDSIRHYLLRNFSSEIMPINRLALNNYREQWKCEIPAKYKSVIFYTKPPSFLIILIWSNTYFQSSDSAFWSIIKSVAS